MAIGVQWTQAGPEDVEIVDHLQEEGQDMVERAVLVNADADLRLCRFFGLSGGYWLRAQAAYYIEVAVRELEPELKEIMPWSDSAA